MKAVITVIGKDRVGIIHEITGVLSKNNVNVLNITQSILDGYFTMIMLTDVSNTLKSFDAVRLELDELAKNIHMDIRIQHEDIFNSMHKI